MSDIRRDRLLHTDAAARQAADPASFRRAADQLAGSVAINGLVAALLAVQKDNGADAENLRKAARALVVHLHQRLPLDGGCVDRNPRDAVNAAVDRLLKTTGAQARFHEEEALSFLAELKLVAKAREATAKARGASAEAGV